MKAETVDIGDDYLEAMGIEIIEGRELEKDSETDKKSRCLYPKSLWIKWASKAVR